MNRILVSGASGNIGRELVKNLINEKIEFQALSSQIEKIENFISKGINAIHCDFKELKTFENVFESGDILFLLNPLQENMFQLLENIIKVAKSKHIKHIVKISALGADSSSDVIFNKIQGLADDIIIKSGINYTILRPNSFMQNFVVYYSNLIKNGNEFYFAHGNGRVSYIDVRDIALCTSKILKNHEYHINKIYEITGKNAISNYEIAEIFSHELNKEIRYIEISELDSKNAMLGANIPEWNVNVLSSLDKLIKTDVASYVSPDFKNIMNFEQRDFRGFVKDYKSVWM